MFQEFAQSITIYSSCCYIFPALWIELFWVLTVLLCFGIFSLSYHYFIPHLPLPLRPISCETVFFWGFLFVRSSLFEIIFFWGHLFWRLSASEVIFLWGCLHVRLYSCEVVFLWGYLPARLSSCLVVFLLGRLPAKSSSCEVLFLWGSLPFQTHHTKAWYAYLA